MSFECRACHDRARVTCASIAPYSSFGRCETCGTAAPCSDCKCKTKARKAPRDASPLLETPVTAYGSALEARAGAFLRAAGYSGLPPMGGTTITEQWLQALNAAAMVELGQTLDGLRAVRDQPSRVTPEGSAAAVFGRGFDYAQNCCVDILGYPTFDVHRPWPIMPLEMRGHIERYIESAIADTRETCAAFLEQEANAWRHSKTGPDIPPNRGSTLEDAAKKLRGL